MHSKPQGRARERSEQVKSHSGFLDSHISFEENGLTLQLCKRSFESSNVSMDPIQILENSHFSFSVSLSTLCNYRRVKLQLGLIKIIRSL